MRHGIAVIAALTGALLSIGPVAYAEPREQADPSGSTEVTVRQADPPAQETQVVPVNDLDQTGASSLVLPCVGAFAVCTAIAAIKGTKD